jgi:V-type H+-transporting ATPase subunit H
MILEDSPTHQSELFWKMNANKLDQNQQELVKILLKILKRDGTRIEELKIALHDLGQYSKFAQGSKEYLYN